MCFGCAILTTSNIMDTGKRRDDVMTNDELLLAMSDLLDIKLKSALQSELQPLKDSIRDIKLYLENITDKDIQLLS